jgi:DNA-binding response OmpR family regulator
MSQTLVLSIGLDLAVLNSRDLLLQSADYTVVPAMSAEEGRRLFQDGDFDLIILCHTLPIEDCERLTRFIRASGSRIPIASVCGGLQESPLFADATLEKSPIEFLAGIRDLLARRSRTATIAETTSDLSRKIIPEIGTPISRSHDGRHEKEMQNNAGTSGFVKETRERVASR